MLTSRDPAPCDATVHVAPVATRMGHRSEMGLALTTLPARDDTLRIWSPAKYCKFANTAAKTRHFSAGCVAHISLSFASSVASVTAPPTAMPASLSLSVVSSGTRTGEIKHGNTCPRYFASMPSSVLPTTTRPIGCSCLICSSCARDPGRCQAVGLPRIANGVVVALSTAAWMSASLGVCCGGAASEDPGDETALNARRIGRYPVHRHRLPSNASSMSTAVGFGLCCNNAYIDMTMPGVQNPHCDPCPSASSFCIVWRVPLRTDPIPSTVVTAAPSTEHSGARQALTDFATTVFVLQSNCRTVTVHAPQPPSPHPSFVPERCRCSRRYVSSVIRGSGLCSVTLFPLTQNSRKFLVFILHSSLCHCLQTIFWMSKTPYNELLSVNLGEK
eukprot:m.1137871 g.1137871  ORF g.1137871 m.1137871 type:complete len:388 (+) comp24437_c1_seq4:2946-4109(+)